MQSETIGKLAEALAKAQGVIKSAVKGKENPYFKSSYADLPAIMDACRVALSENGIAVIQSTDFDDKFTDGLATVSWIETRLIHSSGEWVSGRYILNPTKSDPQGVGSAITYARRYALAAMVGVVAENEDDDAESAMGRDSPAPARPAPKPPAPPKPAPDTGAAKKAAVAFAQKALQDLDSLTLKEQLTAWEVTNKPKLDRLADYDKELAEDVGAAILDARARVS